MEMPEGWLEAKASLDPNYDRSESNLNYALDLLKEMAETLNRVECCITNPTNCELTGKQIEDARNSMSDWMNNTLNKFKDWK